MLKRRFLLGFGTAGLAWLFKRQIRAVAVSGTKGVLLINNKIKRVINSGKEGVSEIIEEAAANNMREKIDALNLTKQEIASLNDNVNKLSEQLEVMKEAIAEQDTKEK